MRKAIITVIGKDSIGIIAGVCTFLADKNINILDITQSILDGNFTMMMVVDVTNVVDINGIIKELEQTGQDLGVVIKLQREEIFESMHRI